MCSFRRLGGREVVLMNIQQKREIKTFGKGEVCNKEYTILYYKLFNFENDLPGCIGFSKPEPPNNCDYCSSFSLCKIIKQKLKGG